jgi:hypothetical protein
MKKRILLLAVLGVCLTARAQQKQVLTAAGASCTSTTCLSVGIDPAQGGATLTVSANASGNTIQFEASGDGGTSFVPLNATPSNSTTAVTSTTSTGTWQANVAGYTTVRMRMSTLVGGTTTVSINNSTASARAGGGGGGGAGTFGPNYSVGAGTAQAQTVAPTTAVTNATLVNGYDICWLPNAANTGAAPTLAGSGTSTFSAKPITKYGTVALVANDITTTGIACARYDGTEFQLQVPLAGGVYTGSVSVGSGASAAGATATGGFAGVEAASTGWTATAGQDYIRFDSTLHTPVGSSNGASELSLDFGACATANALSIFTSANVHGCGNADFTYATDTLTGAAAGLVNLSALTAADALRVPFSTTDLTGSNAGGVRVESGGGAPGAFEWDTGGGRFYAAAAGNSSQTSTTCTNQVVTAIFSNIQPTCSSLTPAFLPWVVSTSSVTSSNPAINTDQNLIQLSLSAGYLNSLKSFSIDGSGIYSSTAASTPALTIKAKLCTVSGCGSGTVVALFNIVTTALNTTALTNATWNLTGMCVTNATGATGNLVCHGKPGLTLDTGATLSAPDTVFADTNTATLANIDLTAALFLQFTVAQSVVGASNSYTQQLASIR